MFRRRKVQFFENGSLRYIKVEMDEGDDYESEAFAD